MKTVLVTGGAGFIGSCVVRRLLLRGWNVRVLDDYSSGFRSNLPDSKKLSTVTGNTLDKEAVSAAVKGCSHVVHLAAQAFIPASFDQPSQFFSTNIGGTLNVLLASAQFGVKRLVFASSAEVYGSALVEPMSEEHPQRPVSPYAESKVHGEALVRSVSRWTGLETVVLRLFNSYGPRQTLPYIVPEIIRQLFAGQRLYLGSTTPRRDFTFVEDTAKAIVAATECRAAAGATLNVGSGASLSVLELAELLAHLMEREVEVVTVDERRRRQDVEILISNSSRAEAILGWKAITPLRIGLLKTVTWYREKGSWPYEHVLPHA